MKTTKYIGMTIITIILGVTGLIVGSAGTAFATGTTPTTTNIVVSPEGAINGTAGETIYLGIQVGGENGVPTGAWDYTVTYSDQASGQTETCATGNSSLNSSGEWDGNIYVNSATCALPAVLTVTVNYEGNSTYAPSSAQQSVSVPSATSTTISGPSSASPGSSITFTSSVSAYGWGTPTGTISFIDTNTGNTLCTVSETTGTASCTTSAITQIGSNLINATYSGSSDYSGSQANTTTTITNPTATTTTVSVSPNPVYAGQTETITVQVTSSSGTPTGAFTYTITEPDGTVASQGTESLNNAGEWSISSTISSSAPTGYWTATATYTGNSTYASSSGSATLDIESPPKTATSTSLNVSPNPTSPGQTETFTATVSSASGTPTGTVAFSGGGSNNDLPGCSSVALNSSGVATCTYTVPSDLRGDYSYSATYTGNSTYASSGGGVTLIIDVNTTATTTTVSASPNPVYAGETETLEIQVTSSSGTPSGQVDYKTVSPSGTTVSSGTLTLNSSGIATLSAPVASSTPTGTYTLDATYEGNSTYATSSGSTTLTIESPPKATTSTSMTVSSNPVPAGQSVTFAASVQSASGTPTGTVAFSGGGASDYLPGCSEVSLSSGVATCTYTIPSGLSGQVTYSATYSGNATLAPSTEYLVLTIESVTTASTTTLSANPGVYAVPGSTDLTALVVGSSGTPTGTITFSFGATVLCSSVSLSGTGSTSATASCRTSSLPIGTNTVTATYSGSSVYSASSATTTVQVVADPAAVTVTANPTHITSGQTTTLTATVKDTINNLPETNGTITFGLLNETLCVETPNTKGTASCATADLPIGTDTVYIQWSGTSGGKNVTAYGRVTVIVVKSSPPPPPPTPAPPAPVVTAISPSSGPTSGGTLVTITGTNLFNAGYVFFGNTAATKFNVDVISQFDIKIIAVAPPGTGTVNVTVTTPGGTSATSSADQFTYVTPTPPAPVQSGWQTTQVRICDTRPGNRSDLSGTALLQCEGDTLGGARQNLTIQVAGLGGVPANATAAILNVTASHPTAEGELIVCPADSSTECIPVSSFQGGAYAVAAAISVALGGGKVTIEYRGAGFTNVIVDVEGYTTSPTRFPIQLIKPVSVFNGHITSTPVAITVTGTPTNTTGVALRITVSGANANGFITIYPYTSGSHIPVVSAINYSGNGSTISNVMLAPNGKLYLYANGGDPLVTITVVGITSETQVAKA